MAAPEPLQTATGVRIFSVSTDGTTPSLWLAYFAVTLSSLSYAHPGVYVISGTPKTGYWATSGSTAAAGPNVPCDGAVIMASPDNTEDIWVGASSITTNKSATDGYRLAAGQSVGIACRNLNTVYIRRGASTDMAVYYSAQGQS